MLLFMFFLMVLILLSLAFLTLSEHFLLALSQNRLSPNKSLFYGLFQALVDGLKLLQKEYVLVEKMMFINYYLLTFINFSLMLILFFIIPYFYFFSMKLNFFFLLFIIGLSVYFFIVVSYFSKSKYAIFGSLRSSSQALSFDIIFIFSIIMFIFMKKKFIYYYYYFFFGYMFFFFYFFFLIMAELNRAPFDFSEGESELVSGYNLELGSLFFIFFFLSEYGFLVYYVLFLNYLFFNYNYLFGFIIFFIIIFIRSVLPRYRYDMLMSFFWLLLFIILFIFFLLLIILF
uniref:NADH-ubiquinone oxidoreductase chain 1 n=1 Tax=Radopholus similis TaxID=46012 RepID=C7TQP2_RADSI|nr:NADH dehydrogenase subunit 1 [Radopholus similis]